ncbi:hypothetical protein TWF679_004141 [Orbilia oligospora]|uniref:Nephrocystin 3-like N-terminal domain-containing protein n=1 Tax=Orbilia oligospora TaxID=2813651 RepID=A0A8H8VM27_ORBOL|nr:hypothetical protein TWF679_004141 [Orbilia oligospora]
MATAAMTSALTIDTDPGFRRPSLARKSTFAPSITIGERSPSCWNAAKERFRLRTKEYKHPPNPEDLRKFFRQHANLDEVISGCEELKLKADGRYQGRIGDLLGVLSLVKDTGDTLLAGAPETVGIAWGVISLLIGVGKNDMSNCEKISEASTNIVTIILNCQLYENRHIYAQQTGHGGGGRIIESILKIITMILEFFWLANRKLGETSKLKRFGDFFKFNSPINTIYEDIIKHYVELRRMGNDQFEETVLKWLNDFKAQNLKFADQNARALKELIFPSLDKIWADVHDIKSGINTLFQNIHDSKSLQEVTSIFEKLYKELKPSDVHLRQRRLAVQPVRRVAGELCSSQWLFAHKHYKSWAEGAVRFLYLNGDAGFGKSVTMAAVTEKLGKSNSSFPQTERCPVLFFFFKKGDDETELANSAVSSLLIQLFDEQYATTIEEKKAFIKALEMPTSTSDKASLGAMQSHKATSDAPLDVVNEIPSSHQGVLRKGGLGSRERSSSVTTNITKLKRLAKVIGRTIYIIMDGVDECTDRESSGLISELLNLGRSTDVKVKILLSSRKGFGLEKFFVKEKIAMGKSGTPHAGDVKTGCQIQDDYKIFTINEHTNEADMRGYLEDCLTELLGHSSTDQKYFISTTGSDQSRDGTALDRKQTKEIKRMIETIQKRAAGMFTYSTMVIASLRQPSPLSIKKRVEELPSEMNNLYANHLNSLTIAQKDLVILALKRIALAPRAMNTLEIVDQFKRVYLDSDKNVGTPDCSDEEKSNDGISENTETKMKSELISPIETMKLEMKEPEVIYTIRHLEAAGREFFKFSNEKATIEFIHKSVLDWVIKESEAAEKFYSGQMAITKIFKFEENGEMQITVPRNFLEGYSGNFQGTKEAYLDILIYTLEVLANTRFQERYIPTYYSLKDPVSPTDPYLPCPSTPPDDAMRERARVMTEDSNHHRGELTHLDFYMFEVSQSWAIGERKGTKWAKLHGLLHKLSDPKVFARWSTQFLLLNNVKLDDILKPSEVITPAILAAEFQWGLYLDFLVTNATVEPASYPEALNEGPPKWKWYNILSDLQRSSIFGYSILHTKGIRFWSENVEQILQIISPRENPYRLRDLNNHTPLTKCLQELQGGVDPTQREFLVDTMKVMLKYDLEPNLCFNGVLTPEGPTLFSVLLMSCDYSLVSLVLKKYGGNPALLDINHRDSRRRTPLHMIWLIKFPDPTIQIKIARLLLESYADPNAQNASSLAPLALAAPRLNESGVKLLLNYKANVNDDDISGNTAFTITADDKRFIMNNSEEKVISMLKLLKNHGADISRPKKGGMTALMTAIMDSRWKIADAILEMHRSETKSGDCSYLMQADREGDTLLHIAAKRGAEGLGIAKFVVESMNEDSIIDLLEKENNDCQTAFDITSLSSASAALKGYFVACYYRYHKRQKDGSGTRELWLPRYLASRFLWSPEGVLEYMEKSDFTKSAYEALITTQPYAKWLLHTLVSYDQGDLISKIMVAGADLYDRDEEGWDTFDWAYAHGLEVGEQEGYTDVDYEARRLDWDRSGNKVEKWETKHRALRAAEDGLRIRGLEEHELEGR